VVTKLPEGLSESYLAVTNAVRHAYPVPSRTGAFHVVAAVAGDELWVLVADDACGYQTPAQCPGLG
jgi:LytS/YehU family sensor histidine kinase